MNIFEKVRKLEFPLGKYVVVGGAMEAHGIRPGKDIDIVVTIDFYDELIQKGWRVCDCDKCEMSQRKILKGDKIDILPDYSWGEVYRIDTKRLIEDAEIISGIPFVKLEELLKWKKAARREKDLKDIELIERYLSQEVKK